MAALFFVLLFLLGICGWDPFRRALHLREQQQWWQKKTRTISAKKNWFFQGRGGVGDRMTGRRERIMLCVYICSIRMISSWSGKVQLVYLHVSEFNKPETSLPRHINNLCPLYKALIATIRPPTLYHPPLSLSMIWWRASTRHLSLRVARHQFEGILLYIYLFLAKSGSHPTNRKIIHQSLAALFPLPPPHPSSPCELI